MNKLVLRTMIACFIFSPSLYAVNLLQYTSLLKTKEADGSSRDTVYGIIDSCGTATRLNDDCTIQGLTRVAKEENNALAKSIVSVYQTALNEGQYDTQPECQTDDHFQANRIIGHCWLLMNYYALQADPSSAESQYSLCLQGGFQGLVYQGNIVAQYMLAKVYDEKGISGAGENWRNAIDMRKDTQAYNLLKKCYM